MTRDVETSSDHLITPEERKYGSFKGIVSVNKSFTKLSLLRDRNYSIKDVQRSLYSSPSNFAGIY